MAFFCVFFTSFFQQRAVVCYASHAATRQNKCVNKMLFCGKGKAIGSMFPRFAPRRTQSVTSDVSRINVSSGGSRVRSSFPKLAPSLLHSLFHCQSPWEWCPHLAYLFIPCEVQPLLPILYARVYMRFLTFFTLCLTWNASFLADYLKSVSDQLRREGMMLLSKGGVC